ncbi:MAG: hypothetical protein ACYDAZ_05110 [Thermoplasmataceae archaeon]
MNFREIVYALIDGDMTYFSSSGVHRILKRHDMVRTLKTSLWFSKKPDIPEKPDEI